VKESISGMSETSCGRKFSSCSRLACSVVALYSFSATVRMSHQDGGANLIKQGGNRIAVDVHIDRSGIRGHRAEVLLKRFGRTRELHTWEIIGPRSHPEHVEPPLLVRRGIDRCSHGAAPRRATTRLIDHLIAVFPLGLIRGSHPPHG
jgi:hypothetical protein